MKDQAKKIFEKRAKSQLHSWGLYTLQTLQLTLLQLVVHYNQEGHRDHKEVDDEADLTQLADGGPTHVLHHRLVGALATDGGGVAQDDQTTDQEHQGHLGGGREIEKTHFKKQGIICCRPIESTADMLKKRGAWMSLKSHLLCKIHFFMCPLCVKRFWKCQEKRLAHFLSWSIYIKTCLKMSWSYFGHFMIS